MADIFFTYAADDAGRVAEIAKALEAQGLSVDWTREILPGQNRVTEMTRRLAEARAVVVVWSNRSVAAPMVLDEAGAARDQGKLVPVMIDRIEPPLGFRQLHTSDLSGAVGTEQLALLAQALKAREAGGGAATPGPGPGPGWGATAPIQPPPSGKFVLTRKFWSMTSLFTLVMGLIWFLTPDSAAEMGAESATRLGYLIGLCLFTFVALFLGRLVIYWSRLIVGKRTTRYFDLDFSLILALGAAIGLFAASQPNAPNQDLGVVVQVLAFVVFGPLMFGSLLLVARGVLRLARGKAA
ncbi:MAG: TIR domain-containing protein [Alphaproteobacteria bacterium]|nr:TIR domain-containing protein [Alphaproteobacteria bacterium]